jgi:hypothetical protein
MTQTTAEDLLRRTLPLLSTHSPDNDNKLICDILNHLQKFPPCLGCGATTTQEAKARCTRTTAKDVCHGCELWPDEIVFDAPKPLAVEGVQVLADDEELLGVYHAARIGCITASFQHRGWSLEAEGIATLHGLRAVLACCGRAANPAPPADQPPAPPSTEKLFTELDQLLNGIDRHLSPPQP